ncbi:MAG: tRNA dihydrouridine(20/20a) synthase DusA [Gammaproteobacteria bacterium]
MGKYNRGVAISRRINHRFSVAPMMDWTDRHCRYLLRLVTADTLLYTEMVTTHALLYGDRDRFLRFNSPEHPLVLQLGGSDPLALAECARLAMEYGYDEINLNVGCPSDRVQSGRFGACLMAEPGLVADCVAAMQDAVALPVTVKCRTGIDERDSYEELAGFIRTVSNAGCGTFIIHARKAFLQGLSPKENRTVPPLNYDYVYRIKQQFPGLEIIINGGIRDLDSAQAHLGQVDGVMLGRVAYHEPYMLAGVDARFYGAAQKPRGREEIVHQMLAYIEAELAAGTLLKHITRHMLGLFAGEPGARHWRRYLGQYAHKPGAGTEVVLEALEIVSQFSKAAAAKSGCVQQHG